MKRPKFIRSIRLRIEIARANRAARAFHREQRAVNAALTDLDAAGERVREFIRQMESENCRERNQ